MTVSRTFKRVTPGNDLSGRIILILPHIIWLGKIISTHINMGLDGGYRNYF